MARTRERTRIEAGIYKEKLASGEWSYIVYIYPSSGTINLGSFPSLPDARKARKVAQGTSAEKGEKALGLAGRRQTVKEFVRDWLERRRTDEVKPLRPSTLRSTTRVIERYIIPTFGHRKVSALDYAILDAGYQQIVSGGCRGVFHGKNATTVQRKKPMSPKYARNILQILRQITRDMKRRNLITSDAGRELIGPPIEKREVKVYGVDLVTAIIAAMREPYRSAALLSLLTGIRQGELLSLTWSDFDFDTRVLKITKNRDQLTGQTGAPKTGSGKRSIPISEETVAFLRAYRERQQRGLKRGAMTLAPYAGPYLFPAMRRRTSKYARLPVIDPGKLTADYRRAARTVIQKEGDSIPRWHDLRHVFASLALARSGRAALMFVSKCLGHADAKITLGIYSHLLPGEADDHLDAVSSGVFASDALRRVLPIPKAHTKAKRKAQKAGKRRRR